MGAHLLPAHAVVDLGLTALARRNAPEVNVLAVVGDDVTVTIAVGGHETTVVDVDPIDAAGFTPPDLALLTVERTGFVTESERQCLA